MGYPVAVTQEVTLCMEKETVKRIFLFFLNGVFQGFQKQPSRHSSLTSADSFS